MTQLITMECMKRLRDSRDSIVSDMCSATGDAANKLLDVNFDLLHKRRTVTKEKTCQWLSSVCDLLESVFPLLETASDEISNLKTEKISDANKIIELQKQLIEKQEKAMAEIVEMQNTMTKKKEENLVELKSVVQTEMKSYSSMLQKTCSNAFAPRKLQAAVKRVTEQEDRSRNVMLFGIEENECGETHDDLVSIVGDVLTHLDEKPAVTDCCRVGIASSEKRGVRPIRFTLRSTDMVRQILGKTTLLKNVSGYEEIYLSPDRSPKERVAHRNLVEQLRQKFRDEPNRMHFIRNNKIISRDESQK